eukprot:TRINITY_DN5771_c0_g6_i1.p1 TRINITY_DN5771_c0_g6~~TRINITY_DN5771_c0_g6_i1.p1  ORF type:complete len:114 (-),score=5.46 TRINITY_DN5771_c0_g6_i1:554-895(-)
MIPNHLQTKKQPVLHRSVSLAHNFSPSAAHFSGTCPGEESQPQTGGKVHGSNKHIYGTHTKHQQRQRRETDGVANDVTQCYPGPLFLGFSFFLTCLSDAAAATKAAPLFVACS